MKYVKFKVKQTDLSTSDYSARIMSGPQVQEPEIWILANNDGAVIVFPDRMYMWVGANTVQYLAGADEQVEQKPVTEGINSNTLLKAIAIAQRPDLAISLIKD